MPFEKKLPEWNNSGTEPPQSLKDSGWGVEQKPPADYFNWFFNRVYLALKELQETGASLDDLNTLNQALTNALAQSDTKAKGYANTAEGNAKVYTDSEVANVQSNLGYHVNNKNNPHGTTKNQVGLGNVQNYGIATKADAEAGTNDAVYMTALKVAQAIAVLQAIKSVNGKTGNVSLSAADVGSYSKVESDATFAPKTHVGASGISAHPAATQQAAGFMSTSDKTKLDGIENNANNYVHPTGDGNQHVPATGTGNNKKVLKAGTTAGSVAWGNVDWSELTGKPSTFTPSGHNHPISEVTNLQNSLDSKANASDLAKHQAETASKFTNINLNIIDMAVELETLKGATLNGVTANIFVETFTNLNDINLMNGIYDSTNKRLVL